MVQAGTIGPAEDKSHKLFVSLDAVYSWLNSGSYVVEDTSVPTSVALQNTTSGSDGWGGRLAVGAMLDSAITLPLSHRTVPLDVLFGAMYRYKYLDIFGKAGVMVENFGAITRDMGDNNKDARSVAMPELSGGLIYNLTPEVGIDLTYFYVFGASSSLTHNFATDKRSFNTIVPTSISALQFGLRYKFA